MRSPDLDHLQRSLSAHLFPASPSYLLGVVLLAVIYWVLPRRLRGPLLLGASLAHAGLVSGWPLALLLFLCTYVWWRARLQRERPCRLSWTVAVPLGAFVLLKAPLLVSAVATRSIPIFVPIANVSSETLVLPLGVSYCLFRLIAYVVEVHRGRVEAATLPDLLLYVLFFPTFRAGPIERYERFVPADRPAASDLNAGLFRIVAGLLKKVLLADIAISALLGPLLAQADLWEPLRVLLRWYAVSFVVYLDFSGYSDIAIGISRLFGYRILENFDYPYLKANIAEFWRSWHISLHLIIRDYFFFPLFGRATSLKKMLIGLFLSFVCSQIWHALSLNFLLLGAYHGVLLVIWGLYDRWRRRKRGAISSGPARVLGAVGTFHLVTAGFWLFFWGRAPLDQEPGPLARGVGGLLRDS